MSNNAEKIIQYKKIIEKEFIEGKARGLPGKDFCGSKGRKVSAII